MQATEVSIALNIINSFCEYRKYAKIADIDADVLAKSLANNQYIKLQTSRDQQVIVFIIIQEEGEYANHTPKLTQLLTQINNAHKWIIVVGPTFYDRRAMMTTVTKMSAKMKIQNEVIPFSALITVVPKHITAPTSFTIMTEEEMEHEFTIHRINKNDLPVMKETDPLALWHDCHVGDVVKIVHVSHITTQSITYKLITRAIKDY